MLVRRVAILATGACFNSRYELYAHVAESTKLSLAKITAIAAGQRPPELSLEEAVAYDVASALAGDLQLPGSTYKLAMEAFGKEGVGNWSP